MKKFLTLIACCFSLAVSATDIPSEDLEKIFSSQNKSQIKTSVQTLPLSGYTNESAFDAIEAEMLRSLPLASDKESIDYTAWLLKGLAFSGNPKYRETLEQVYQGKHHKKVRKYAKKSLQILEQYQQWNPILASQDSLSSEQSSRNNALKNALLSDLLELKRQASRYIYNNRVRDEFLLDVLQQELESSRLLKHEKHAIDTYAWMAKALASSSNPKYQHTIADIAANSSEKKLRKYAKKYLKSYF